MVTHKDILQIASLAKLSVGPEELDGLTKDMNEIIGFADTIGKAVSDESDFDNINGLENVFREDVPGTPLDREKILQNTDSSEDGYFLVRRRQAEPARKPHRSAEREFQAATGASVLRDSRGPEGCAPTSVLGDFREAGGPGTIAKLHNLLVSKQISCTELTKQYLAAIERENGALNAYIRLTPETALEAAARVDKKIASGEELSPLDGIPMTLKDNISTDGIETSCCSKILEGYVPIYDATVWALLKKQNAVLLGKTNMDEFAMGSSCETSCFGGAKNPHNKERVAGGSSGGAAVSANLAAYALGSDTGGSIRQPASFCGIVGFKPTYGTVSRYGLIAYASSFDQIGPITQSVEDAALVYDAVAKYDEMDSTSSGRKEPTVPQLGREIKGLKIGIAREYFDGIREDVDAALQKAITAFRALGAEIVEFSMPSLKYCLPVYYILACAEASSNLGRYDGIRYGYHTEHYADRNDMVCKTRSEGFGTEVKRRILLGTYVLSAGYYDAYYKKAQNLRGALVRAFDGAFLKCDLMLAPTVPTTAFPQNYTAKDPVETYLTDICTVPVNIAGLPGISVPCGFGADGMPVGMQLIGPKFSEVSLLNAARQYELAARDEVFRAVETGVIL